MAPTFSNAGALVAALSLSTHRYVSGIIADRTYYSGYSLDKETNNGPVVGWSTSAADQGYISPDAYDSLDIICGRDADPTGASSARVVAGSTIELQWNAWAEGNHGPVLDYLAKCDGDCSAVNKDQLKFFKISEAGFVNGRWASEDLVANKNTWFLTIPDSIAPGNYVLRHEIISLLDANDPNGARNYPQCFNLEINSAGSEIPAGVPGTELYKPDAEGILFDIYQAADSYPIPGPPLFNDGGTTEHLQFLVPRDEVVDFGGDTGDLADLVLPPNPGEANPDLTSPGDFDGDLTPPGDFDGDLTPPGDFDGDLTPPGDFDGDLTPPGDFDGDLTPPGDFDGDLTPPGDFDGDLTPPGNFDGDLTPPGDFDGDLTPPGDFDGELTPGNPVDPKDPVTPVNPVDPVDPKDPVTPPVDQPPENPADPKDPIEPPPTDQPPENPGNQVDPKDPVTPPPGDILPENPGGPGDPISPPTDQPPENPGDQVDPKDPVTPPPGEILPENPGGPGDPISPPTDQPPENPGDQVDPKNPVAPPSGTIGPVTAEQLNMMTPHELLLLAQELVTKLQQLQELTKVA